MMKHFKSLCLAAVVSTAASAHAEQFVIEFEEGKSPAQSADLINQWKKESDQDIRIVRGEGTDLWVIKVDLKEVADTKKLFAVVNNHKGIKQIEVDQTRRLMPEEASNY